jgi:hypothetical protein
LSEPPTIPPGVLDDEPQPIEETQRIGVAGPDIRDQGQSAARPGMRNALFKQPAADALATARSSSVI